MEPWAILETKWIAISAIISVLCILPGLVALEVWSRSPVDAERELEREKAKRDGCPLL